MHRESTHDALNRYKLPTITICIGILAAIFVFSMMLSFSMKQLEKDFTGDAKLHMTILRDWLSLNIDEMEILSKLLATEPSSAGETPDKLADPLIKRHTFEEMYWVKPSGAVGQLTVQDISARDKPAPALTAFPALNAEITQALQTGQPLATPVMPFPRGSTAATRIGLVFPVIQGGKAKGALVALLDPDSVFNKAFGATGKYRNAEAYIFENGEPGWDRMISGRMNELLRSPVFSSQPPSGELIRKSMAFSYSETVPLLSRQWDVVFVPTAKYMAGVDMMMPWAMMGACLMLTGMAGIFLFYLIGQKAHIEKMVQERTTELIHISGELKVRSLDLEKAKIVAEAANNAKGDFLANVSHEIRTPLNSMLGLTEILLESELTTTQENQLRIVLGSAENLTEIINDILDYSKIESGKLDLAPIPFDLEEAIEDTAELFAPRIREKEQKLELLVHVIPGTPRYVIGDPVRVRQILSNLLSNAIKFTQAGYILITAEEVRETVPAGKIKIKISVRDTGIGIPADKLQSIFEKFSQADVSTTRKFGGTGLGLSICRELAAMMHGEVVAENAPDKGTIFSVTMILEHEPGTREDSAAPDRSVLQGKKALIVDDLEISRTILAAQLASTGIDSIGTDTAGTALKMMADTKKNGEKPFDLLVTDYVVSERVSAVFRQQARTLYPDMAIVMVTGLAEKGYAQLFASTGCDAYLTKPIRTSQLLDLLVMIFKAKQSGKMLSMLTPLNTFRKRSPDKNNDDSGFIADAEILLVEDNRANCELALKLLESMRCRATAVRSGEDAIDIVRRQVFDLILMDCQMPEMDGFETSTILCRMKNNKEIPPIPIIALTANAMKGDRERCLESGMNDYIAKPLRKTKLRSVLMQWLPPKGKRVVDSAHNHAA